MLTLSRLPENANAARDGLDGCDADGENKLGSYIDRSTASASSSAPKAMSGRRHVMARRTHQTGRSWHLNAPR